MKIVLINNKKEYFINFKELNYYLPEINESDIKNMIQNENGYKIIRKNGKAEMLINVKDANDILKKFNSKEFFFTPQYREYDIANKYY